MKFLFALTMLISSSAFAAGDCFSERMVRGYSTQGSNEIVVDAGRKDYVLQVSFCSELAWAHRIAFEGFGGRVCRNDRVLILDNFSNRVIQSCRILSVDQI